MTRYLRNLVARWLVPQDAPIHVDKRLVVATVFLYLDRLGIEDETLFHEINKLPSYRAAVMEVTK